MKQADLRIDGEAGRAIRAGYPYLPRDLLRSRTRGLSNGTVVDLVDGKGFAGRGVYAEDSPQAVLVFARDRRTLLDGTFWRSGMERAMDLRRHLVNLSYTDAWRAVNGAGDSLPGVVVESYSSYAVLRLESDALRPHLGPIVDAVRMTLAPRGLYEKRRGPDGGRGHHLGGSTAPDALPVREGNLRFLVRLSEGAETGFALDMRECRRMMARYGRGRQILNCYSSTGTLSLTAAAAGSPRVVSVDPSPRSAAWGRENFAANGLPPDSHEFITGDPSEVVRRLSSGTRRFDLAVVESPLFTVKAVAAAKKAAKSAKKGKGRAKPKPARRPARKPARKGGRRRMAAAGVPTDPVALFRTGYVDLVKSVAGVLQPNGLLACALHERDLAYADFLAVLREASEAAGVGLQVLEVHGLPPDFPVNPAYPRGEDFRFLVCGLRK
jgi:23S rRNA (cytosine1962-C5)-methyltransferase